MGGWRNKLILLLIVYFAGFASAIYCLAPGPAQQDNQGDNKSFVQSMLASDEFAQSFNKEMHKCIDLGKETALKAGEVIKEKYIQLQSSDEWLIFRTLFLL